MFPCKTVVSDKINDCILSKAYAYKKKKQKYESADVERNIISSY